MKITREAWEAKGKELFGDDQTEWRFVCPSCGHEMSISRARSEHADDLPALRRHGYRVEQECIGRHLPGVGCDWAAYGFLRLAGTVLVDDVPAFDFAGRPFTGKSQEVA